MDIARLRREYSRESLDESDVDRDPIAQFGKWFDEALKSELPEPTAMASTSARKACVRRSVGEELKRAGPPPGPATRPSRLVTALAMT
jgi:pyridoxine/pyridoxamine 5'-phosphate oxidase